jgi:hypothetical protein
MALGDVAPAGVERTEHRRRSKSSCPASLELLRERGVHGLAYERCDAHMPTRSLASESRMLGIGEADRDTSHGKTVPHWLTLISDTDRRSSNRSVRVRDHLAVIWRPANLCLHQTSACSGAPTTVCGPGQDRREGDQRPGSVDPYIERAGAFTEGDKHCGPFPLTATTM